ncbi:hypothetical protein BHE74_00051257 [Ensete ventricosum]|nr:hypothetical protein BHE74_00051257 [Ensete ventricosum]
MGLLMPLCSLGFLKAVNTALSCIRTVEAEHVPHLLRFLLLSATPTNVRRIISQIREQLKFVGAINSRAARNKKLKGKSPIDSTEASILDALRLSLLFKNVLIIYYSFLQKSVERILKKKILEGCFREVLFDQCIQGHRELVKVSNPDLRYRKMGIIGTLKIVSTLGGVNATTTFTSTQVFFLFAISSFSIFITICCKQG